MADGQRRRQRSWVAVAHLAYALLVAEAATAATSLFTGKQWDWGRFWWFFMLTLFCAGASYAAEAVAHRINPQAQRRAIQDQEIAQAMRTGLLPPSTDPNWWRAQIRRDFLTGVAVVAFSTVLCVSAATLTWLAARLNNGDDPRLWALAFVSVLLLAPLSWLLVRARRRGRGLLANL